MPNFETFTKRMIPLVKQPAVTIQKRGIMSFNKAAHALLGEPDAIELLYDRDAKIIGVRGVSRDVEHAYPFRPVANGKEDGPYVVSGTAFANYYGIETEVSKRWNATMIDGVLCIDLTQEGTVVTSNRNGRVKREDAEAATG